MRRMKNIYMITFAALGMAGLLSACGSSKQTTAYNYPPQQQYVAADVPQQPQRKKREVDECVTLANEEKNSYRAYGTAISYDEGYAMENAEANAVTAIVQRIETAVEGAREMYNKNSNADTKRMTEGDAQSIVTQYFAGACKNYRVIKTNLYDLSDGSIQAYVCIELRETSERLMGGAVDALSRNRVLETDYDKQEFKKQMQKGMEEYKNSKAQQ